MIPLRRARFSTRELRRTARAWGASSPLRCSPSGRRHPWRRRSPPSSRQGEVVPRDVREIYDRGLHFLVASQQDSGDWTGGGEQGPGVTGMALMVLLASGEDPNFGLYSNNVRRALRSMISQQDATTGILGSSMYHHGFGMLALAEAYGTVDDRNLWNAGEKKGRSIGAALELAVRAAVTSQKKNQFGGWRYSPDSHDADTSVSGAVLVGLLAARNAGIEVSDEAIDRAIKFYIQMTSESGHVAYAGVGASTSRWRESPSPPWSIPWRGVRTCRNSKPRSAI